MAPEPDPDARERASDSAAVVDAVADGSDRSLPSRGELVLLVAPERDDPRAVPDMGVASPAGRLASPSGGGRLARRLRVAPPVQLELVSDREGPKPEAVWASLPEQARGAVLVLLARLIGAGAVEQEGEL